jgi:hypothetical protein
MAAPSLTEGWSIVEQQSREGVAEVERARSAYIEHLREADRDEAELGRLWLHLLHAERRRDELFKTIDQITGSWRSDS